MELHEVRGVVAEFSNAVGVEPPRLVVSRRIKGLNSCYNTLTQRIVVSREVMSDVATVIRVVIAHEVGHATQRRQILREVLLCVSVTVALGAGVLVEGVHETQGGKISILTSVMLLGVLFAWAALIVWGLEKRALNREFEADAIAVEMCGHNSVLAVLRKLKAGSAEITRRITRMEAEFSLQQAMQALSARTEEISDA